MAPALFCIAIDWILSQVAPEVCITVGEQCMACIISCRGLSMASTVNIFTCLSSVYVTDTYPVTLFPTSADPMLSHSPAAVALPSGAVCAGSVDSVSGEGLVKCLFGWSSGCSLPHYQVCLLCQADIGLYHCRLVAGRMDA